MALKFNQGVNFIKLDKSVYNMCTTLGKAVDIDIFCTSAYRTPEENAKIGGISNSSHLKGLAVDISCLDSATRFKVVFGALASGFKRIGIGKTHVHLDIDPDKPQDIIFFDNMTL